MQNNPGMTQYGFNRRQRVGFNYRVADLEMKALRNCISMVLAASHSYEPLLGITVLFCQGMPKGMSLPHRSKGVIRQTC